MEERRSERSIVTNRKVAMRAHRLRYWSSVLIAALTAAILHGCAQLEGLPEAEPEPERQTSAPSVPPPQPPLPPSTVPSPAEPESTAPSSPTPDSPSSAPSPPTSAPSGASGKPPQRGLVSMYGRKFSGRNTASGEPFDPTALTMAHRTLPFGTRVRVTHAGNGRSVIVRINDRGPYVKGRIIDLSRAAASAIGMTGQGIARVSMEVLGR